MAGGGGGGGGWVLLELTDASCQLSQFVKQIKCNYNKLTTIINNAMKNFQQVLINHFVQGAERSYPT